MRLILVKNVFIGLHDGYPATEEGQAAFITDIKAIVANATGGIGCVYWGSEWISSPSFCSAWENLALFDFNGTALLGLDALGSNGLSGPTSSKPSMSVAPSSEPSLMPSDEPSQEPSMTPSDELSLSSFPSLAPTTKHPTTTTTTATTMTTTTTTTTTTTETPPSCSSYTSRTTCQNAGCKWKGTRCA